MGRKKQPPARDVFINVFHADGFDRKIASDEYEDDVHEIIGPIRWGVSSGNSRNPRLLSVEIAHGVSRQTASKLLRQIADAIDRSPEPFMASPEFASGHYDIRERAFVNEWEDLEGVGGESPEVI